MSYRSLMEALYTLNSPPVVSFNKSWKALSKLARSEVLFRLLQPDGRPEVHRHHPGTHQRSRCGSSAALEEGFGGGRVKKGFRSLWELNYYTLGKSQMGLRGCWQT